MKKVLTLAAAAASLMLAATVSPAREVISLNESWRFTPSRVAGMNRWGGANPNAGEEVNLPHTWNAADFMSNAGYRRGYGTYARQLDIPEDYRGKRVFLKFEGAGSMATLLVNNRLVGEHKGPYNTFVFEITDYLRPGASNSLTVICNNEPRFDIAPQSGDFNVYGGLYRDVWMEVTGPECISPLYFGSDGVLIHQKLVTDERAELSAEVHVSSLDGYAGCEVAFWLEDAAGKVVARKESTQVNNGIATCFVGLDRPHLWNGKADPYLYKAVTVLRKEGKEVDRIEEQIGLRYFWVDADKGFFLNGKHLKLQGVCRHQDWADIAVALTKENHLADYDLFDEIGANALRLAHYPQAKFMFQEADRRGYIVWEEIPFVSTYVAADIFDDNLRLQLREMIIQNYNHPSICFWGLQNEVHDSIDAIIGDLNDIAHQLDPVRLTVSATDQELPFIHTPDAVAWNKYYGWYYDTAADFGPFMDAFHAQYPDDRLCISEYGGGGSVLHHVSRYGPENEKNVMAESRARFHPEEKQTYLHYHDWKAIAERDFVWGSFVWNMFDFASSMRREGDTDNQNDKGLVSRDRKTRKDAFYFYKANWNKAVPTLHLCSKNFTEREEDTTDIVVFSTAPTVKLYLNGKLAGTARTDAYATVRWENVKLARGGNTVTVRSAAGEDSAVWTVK